MASPTDASPRPSTHAAQLTSVVLVSKATLGSYVDHKEDLAPIRGEWHHVAIDVHHVLQPRVKAELVW